MRRLIQDKQLRFSAALLAAVLPSTLSATPASVPGNLLSEVPAVFETNHGQMPSGIEFLARAHGYTLLLTSEGPQIVLQRPPDPSAVPVLSWARRPDVRFSPPSLGDVLVRMTLAGARRFAPLVGLDQIEGRVHYFRGSDPGKWVRNVPLHSKASYENVAPGVDLLFYAAGKDIEFDLVLAPGADPAALQLAFDGATGVSLDHSGDLLLNTAAGTLRLRKPVAHQEAHGRRESVDAAFTVLGRDRIGFRVPRHDASRPLVIDPVLTYMSYLGGSDNEYAERVAMDGSGHAYLFGSTYSRDYPGPNLPSMNAHHSRADAFVTKLAVTPEAATLVYSAYIGAGNEDWAADIAIDPDGNAYLGGVTASAQFPTTPGAYASVCRGSPNEGFVTKLSPDGSDMLYSTCLGGSENDEVWGIDVGASGEAVVTGYTKSWDFPATGGAIQPLQPGKGDGFVTKFNAAGSDLVYSTYLGGSELDWLNDLKIDSQGAAYVGGLTYSNNLPTSEDAFQPRRNGHDDSWMAKLSPDGSELVYCTYVGGNCEEETLALDVDDAGNAYFTGYVETHNFPATLGAVQYNHGGGDFDGFVAKLNPDGTGLVYATYLGGYDEDMGFDIDVDDAGNAWVTGYTLSPNFPVTAGAYSRTLRGPEDGFLTVINSTGERLVYSSLFGGEAWDWGESLALDSGGGVWVFGMTESAALPITPGALRSSHAGGWFDILLAHVAPSVLSSICGASYSLTMPVAPGSIVSGFGVDLANNTHLATSVPLPTELSGVRVDIVDSAGIRRPAPLYFVSVNQINFLVLPETALGPANLTVTRYGAIMARGTLEIDRVGPGLFTANADGQGVPVAAVLWVRPDGAQVSSAVYQCGVTAGSCVPTPIDLDPASGDAYLTMYATGIRGRSSLDAVRVTIGGMDVDVLYAGPQGFFIGVDQINIRLPPQLAGTGRQLLSVTVDGKVSNEVELNFQ